MYRKLLATTALSLVLTGGALAQNATPAQAPADPMVNTPVVVDPAAPAASGDTLVTAAETGINANGWLASEIIGEEIYNSSADDAETIGEVNDFVLDVDGSIGAVVVGVGGFLGIGQKNVAVNWADLDLVVGADGNQRLVASLTREQLEAAAEFDRAEWLASETERAAQNMNDPLVNTPAAPMAPAADPAAPAVTPVDPAAPVVVDPAANTGSAMDWNTYQPVMTSEVSTEELTGTTVYGAGDEDIGSIGDIILSDGGEVDAVIIDFGGFLGIGAKPVAVDFENLTFLRDADGDVVLRTSLTREQLEAAPEYNADAYLAAPEQNVLFVE